MAPEVNLRIAVTGSAGVGKTSLARALAIRLELPLIREEMREYLERRGRRLDGLPPDEVVKVVEGLWLARREAERRLPSFVADNCLLDFAAYGLQHAATAGARLARLIDEVTRMADGYHAIFLLPFGSIPYERDGMRSEHEELELRYALVLEALLARHDGNVSAAAREAKIDRNWIVALARRYAVRVRD